MKNYLFVCFVMAISVLHIDSARGAEESQVKCFKVKVGSVSELCGAKFWGFWEALTVIKKDGSRCFLKNIRYTSPIGINNDNTRIMLSSYSALNGQKKVLKLKYNYDKNKGIIFDVFAFVYGENQNWHSSYRWTDWNQLATVQCLSLQDAGFENP
jgi:hypothetical protein